MHRITPALGALLFAAFTGCAHAPANARVATRKPQPQSQPQPQREVGPPAPVELVGEPRPGTSTPVASATDKTALASQPAAATSKMSPMTAALTSAAKDVRMGARAGTLVSPRTRMPIAAGASQAAISYMSWPTAEAAEQIREAFSLSGESESDVADMMMSLSRVLSAPSSDDVRGAQKHLEAFMKRSPAWFSTNPPAEVLAVEAALARMSEVEAAVRGASEKPARTAAAPKK
jgi:hypothetical protein